MTINNRVGSTTESSAHRELASTQTAGFGLCNGNIIQVLKATFDPEAPAVTISHERIEHSTDGEQTDPYETVIEEVQVTPNSDFDGKKLEIGTRHGNDRVRIESHDHASRVYITHERQTGGWSVQSRWEVHPATGITETI